MNGRKSPPPLKKSEASLVRSSASEYLTFIAASGQGGVEAVYAVESIWVTQKMMGVLYDVNVRTVNEHLKKIFADSELQEDSVIWKFRITAADGKSYNTQHYSLPAIIAVGYKVNSERAVQFRKWATLLDGVTSVTPSVRYLAFRAWLVHRYGETGQADDWQTYTDFAARIESALVLGNLTRDRTICGLIGADQALVRLDAGTPQVEVSSLVKSPASTIYTGPSDQLGLSKTRDPLVPALVDTRGLTPPATPKSADTALSRSRRSSAR